jgi:DNA-directed RNA polymerase specialized sigma subunit
VTGRFVKGNPGGGRPKGTRNFETDFDEAVEEIAKENGMTKSEARKLLLKVAFRQAKDGNFNFYKDIHDRIYGKAPEKIEITPDEKSEKNERDIEELSNKFNEFLKHSGQA